MRIAIATLILVVLVSAWPPAINAADEPPELLHNPFSRPPSEVTRSERSAIEQDDGNGGNPDLQATMVGTVSKLANVAGRILKPGDEIEGYLLIAVHEEYAVFRRNSETITVYVNPHLVEEDE